MEFALVLIGNVVMQTLAYAILRPATWWQWIVGAMLIGTAYQLPFLLHKVFA